MDWSVILWGIIVGLCLVATKNLIDRYQRKVPEAVPRPREDTVENMRNWLSDNIQSDYQQRSTSPQQYPIAQLSGEATPSNSLVETWRKSVVGLVRLAHRNVTDAKLHLDAGHFEVAVDGAVTSVENISRALLHCYGEKPELNSGQEEALKLLSRRFGDGERIEFEKAIGEIGRLYRNNIVHTYLSRHNLGTLMLSRTTAASIFDSASKIVGCFTLNIDEHFATEIPEIRDVCPKCRSSYVSMWAFRNDTAYYACLVCGHRWTEP